MIIASKEYVVTKMTELMLTPKKHFSQNFLTDYDVVTSSVNALNVTDEKVIEIGPGLGALTQELLNRNYDVDAYEIDIDMVNHLREEFKSYNNFNLYNEDFLKVDLSKYEDKKLKFISNVPYNVTTPIIEKIITSSLDIKTFEFMVQKEVYERLNVKEKSKDYSPINIFIDYVGKLSVVRKVSYKCYIPMPNVDSIILKIEFTNKINIDPLFNKEFVKLVKGSFVSRRKTILNNLTNYFKSKDKALDVLSKAQIDPSRRPESLTLNDYLELTKACYYEK